MVKKYPNGAASTYMHSLEAGSKLTVRGPIPGYTWQASDTPRDVVFVAGGAGITPIYSLAKEVLKNKQDKTRIQLLWGVNGERDIVLKDEFAALQQQSPERFSITYFLSNAEADAGQATGVEAAQKGYIDSAALRSALQKGEAGQLGDAKGTKVFFCGPPGMQEKLTGKQGVLKELGVAKKEVQVF